MTFFSYKVSSIYSLSILDTDSERLDESDGHLELHFYCPLGPELCNPFVVA